MRDYGYLEHMGMGVPAQDNPRHASTHGRHQPLLKRVSDSSPINRIIIIKRQILGIRTNSKAPVDITIDAPPAFPTPPFPRPAQTSPLVPSPLSP